MRFGFVLPGGSATQQLALAELADQTGWDGLFVWEAAFGIGASTPGRTYELIVEGETPGQDPAADRATVAGWEAAGATWWIEARWSGDPHSQAHLDEVRARLAAGPPKTSGTD